MIPFIVAEAVNESRYWGIEHYDIKAVMNEDGVLSVEEKIVVNFKGQYHGIVRTISMENDIRNIRCSSPFAVETENGELLIRIGDVDTLVTGEVEYMLTFEQDPKARGEFIYSVSGMWDVDIYDLYFSLTVPKDRYYSCAMVVDDMPLAGKFFETMEDDNENLIIRGSAALVPAYGSIDLVLK